MNTSETEFGKMSFAPVDAGLWGAATLLRFAGEVLREDVECRCRWVVLRAIDNAEQELRDAVDEGEDMNAVDAKLSEVRLRIGLCSVRDIINAGRLANFMSAVQILESAAQKCYAITAE